MTWIQWCLCGRYILTTGQLRDGLPCAKCQEENEKKEEAKEDL